MLIYPTGTEGLPVSCLNCDRPLRLGIRAPELQWVLAVRQQIDTRPCTPCQVTVTPACWDGGWAWVDWCLSGIGCRGLASTETCSRAGHYKYIQHKDSQTHTHCHYCSSCTVHTTHTYRHFPHTGLHIGPLWKLSSALAVDCRISLCFHGHHKWTQTRHSHQSHTYLTTYRHVI